MNPTNLKYIVREKYGDIAKGGLSESSGCCGESACCGELEFSMIGDDYSVIDGHIKDADLGLGCGIPTQFAGLKPGHQVIDLGSGAGNDCFIARRIVGEKGTVTGLDFTPAMVERARANNEKLGYTNVSFVEGDIESMPFGDNSFDCILSNCVLNLVPDKQKAFAEMFRVLRPGGHFCISDVVTSGRLPEALKKDAVMYAGCVAGALDMQEYLSIVGNSGFTSLTIHKQKAISIPEPVLTKYLSPGEAQQFGSNGNGIFSLTLSAYK